MLRAFAGEVRHTGAIGTATGLKLVANTTLGVTAAAVNDALTLGDRLGLPRDAVLDVLAAGHFSKLVTGKRDRLESGDHAGGDFTVAAVAKDLALALREADDLPVVRAAALRAIEARSCRRRPGRHLRPDGAGSRLQRRRALPRNCLVRALLRAIPGP